MTYKIGDIVTVTNSYTDNSHFFKVIKATPKSITIRRLENDFEATDGGYNQEGYVSPSDRFDTRDPREYRKFYNPENGYFKFDNYSYGYQYKGGVEFNRVA